MRDYLYVWHEPHANRVLASGIEFRDFLPSLQETGGVVLLRHEFDEPALEPRSRLEFVPAGGLQKLADDNVYGYGDFCWVDFGRGVSLAHLDDAAIAALTFFAHAARPLHEIEVAGLANRFLFYGHDDGWYARIFYNGWDAIGPLLGGLLERVLGGSQLVATRDAIQRGEAAFWCRDGSAVECERTEDIDMIQQKHLTSRSSRPASPAA